MSVGLRTQPTEELVRRLAAAFRGAQLYAPLAATVIGGLVSATVLTLIVIPLLFQVICGRQVARAHATQAQALAGETP